MPRRLFAALLLVGLLAAPAAARAHDATPPASPAAGGADVVLVAATFPSGSLPAGDLVLSLVRATYGPGGGDAYTGGVPGIGVVMVEQGRWTIRSQGPLVALRGPGLTPEPVPAGTETVLAAGDGLAYPDTTFPRERRNTGDGDTVVLGCLVVLPSAADTGTADPSVRFDALVTSSTLLATDLAAAGLTSGPVTLAIRRVTLPPGAELPRSGDPAPTVRYVEQGRLKWGIAADAASEPDHLTRMSAGDQLPWLPLPDGKVYVVRNTGSEPAVLNVLTLTPAAPDATPIAS